MAKLLFFDTDHTYKLDNEIIPSVSEVCRFLSREVYGDVNQYTLDQAANRGTNVHKATELLDRYGSVECEEEILAYVKAYIQWRKDNNIKQENIVEIEKSYGDAELGYAGTIDRIFLINNEYWLVDLKSSVTAQKKLWSASLNGYKQLWEKQTGNKITRMFDLQVKKDGTYSEVDIEPDCSVFNACLTLHNALKTKKRANKTSKTKKTKNDNT